MKRFLLVIPIALFSLIAKSATITWDGGGGDGLWSTAANWVGNVVPGTTDDVLIDNSSLAGSYTITLPNSTVIINSINIFPGGSNTIIVIIPTTSIASPGLQTNASIYIHNGGTLKNSSTAASVPTITIGAASTDSMYIYNGGTYEHNTQRSISSNTPNSILEKTSTAVGTEYGRTHFNVPQTGAAALSLQGRTFGSLEFSAGSAPSALTYTSSGAAGTDLRIRGDFKINSPANFSTTITGNITVAGHFTFTGSFSSAPSAATDGRSLLFNGTSNQNFSGTGTLTFGANFRNIEVVSGATVTLQRGITQANTASNFIVNSGATLQMGSYVVGGVGTFQLLSGGWLGIGHPNGIANSGASGNVQTTNRSFPGDATYEYNSATSVTQVTGNGLPSTISGKLIINTQAGLGTTGVTLSQNTRVDGEFVLTNGKLTTAQPSNMLTLGSSSVTTAAYIDNSFVNGILSKYGNTSYRFPIGSGVDIHPLQLYPSGGNTGDIYSAVYIKASPSCSPNTVNGGIDHRSTLEYWIALCNPVGTPVNQVALYASGYSYATDRTRLVVARCNSGIGWENFGNTDLTTVGAIGDVKSTLSIAGGFTNIFTLASLDPSPINPLPITLISFDASKLTNTKSSVNWELAACCSSTAKFEIQRAGTDKRFVTVGTIGGSTTNRLYDFIDNDLKNGINYYRLKMIDEDGKIIYTKTVAVMNGVNGLLLTSLIPTVVANTTALTIASSKDQKINIIITDIQGKMIRRSIYAVANGNTTIEISLGNLAAGIYHLTGICAEGKTNTIRFLKQ